MGALAKIRKIRERSKLEKKDHKFKISVNMGTSSKSVGANDIYETFREIIKEKNLENVILTQTGESGLSSLEPIIKVIERGKQAVLYYKMDSKKVKEVISEHILKEKIITDF